MDAEYCGICHIRLYPAEKKVIVMGKLCHRDCVDIQNARRRQLIDMLVKNGNRLTIVVPKHRF